MGKLQIILILKIVDANNSVVLNQKAKWMEKMYLLELTYLYVYICNKCNSVSVPQIAGEGEKSLYCLISIYSIHPQPFC